MERSLSRPLADVVVPIHGGWDYVQACLASLGRQSVNVNVIVVDDDSPDDSARKVEEHFPEVQLLRSGENVGFARACNLGISAGSAPIVVLVNSDVVADERLIQELIGAFDTDAVGSATAVLTDRHGRVDAAGVTIDPTLAGFVRYQGSAVWSPSSPEVGCVYGAAAAYRRDALDSVGGGFDENLFMYGEELELGLRLLSGGWEVRLVERARAVHTGGGTVGKGSSRQRYLAGFGRGYILRVYGVLKTRFALRALLVEIISVTARLLASRDLASLRGRIHGWRAAKTVPRRTPPLVGIDYRIGLAESIKARMPSYWTRYASKWTHLDRDPFEGLGGRS